MPRARTFIFLGKTDLAIQIFKKEIFSSWWQGGGREASERSLRDTIKILLRNFLKGKLRPTAGWSNIWYLMAETSVGILQSLPSEDSFFFPPGIGLAGEDNQGWGIATSPAGQQRPDQGSGGMSHILLSVSSHITSLQPLHCLLQLSQLLSVVSAPTEITCNI